MQYKGYTIEILGKTENGNAYLVDVKATKGTEQKTKQFDGVVSHDGIKSAVKNWIDNDELKTTLPSTGVLDFSEVVPEVVEPTAEELAKTEYDAERERLRVLMELVRDGVFTGSESQISALQAKVRKGFKVEYLG